MRLPLALALIVVLMALPGATSSAPPPASAPGIRTAGGVVPATSGVLNVYGSFGSLASTFWGVNYDANKPQTNFENSTLAADLNATPIRFVRGVLQWTNASLATQYAFAQWSSSQLEVTIDWNLTLTPAQDAAEVQALETTYGVHPAFWAYGNEPATKGVSSIAYARNLQTFIADVRAFDSGAHFVGLETQVPNSLGAPYLFNVSKVDGPNITAVAIHTYPDNGVMGNVEQDFVSSLYTPLYGDSVFQGAILAWAQIKAGCPACSFQLWTGETNSGPDNGVYTAYAPYRQGYDDVVYYAASVIQAWEENVSRFSPWTLAEPSDVNCDTALVELGTCNGIRRTLNPSFEFFAGLAPLLPTGTLYNASVTGSSHVYAAEDVSGGTKWVLLVNANLTNTVSVELGSSFSGISPLVTAYWMSPTQSLTVGQYAQNLTTAPALSLPPMEVLLVKVSTGGGSGSQP
ncbi:MAG: hypothetical protein L3J91_00060, partial [Thermoplasmata archaeon]|nr:hypothetical protein [Thermoplasmata archaeon]